MAIVDRLTRTRIETDGEHTESNVTVALDRAIELFDEWRDLPIREREQRLATVGEVLQEHKREDAERMTQEISTPSTRARAEVGKCAWICHHYAKHASADLHHQLVKSDPRVPFGGVKDSGHGRELSGAKIKEFVTGKSE